MDKTNLKIEYVDPKKLKPYERNPRIISNEAMEGLKISIQQFGIVDPFVVNDKLTIIGGHQRCKAAIGLGHKQVPVVYVNLPVAEEKALNVALNSRYISGDWTVDLGDLLGEIQADLPDLFEGLNFEDLLVDVPEIEVEIAGSESEGQESSGKEKQIKCPECGHEF